LYLLYNKGKDMSRKRRIDIYKLFAIDMDDTLLKRRSASCYLIWIVKKWGLDVQFYLKGLFHN